MTEGRRTCCHSGWGRTVPNPLAMPWDGDGKVSIQLGRAVLSNLCQGHCSAVELVMAFLFAVGESKDWEVEGDAELLLDAPSWKEERED